MSTDCKSALAGFLHYNLFHQCKKNAYLSNLFGSALKFSLSIYLTDLPDLITNFEKVLNKIIKEINDKIEKYKIIDFNISNVVVLVSNIVTDLGM